MIRVFQIILIALSAAFATACAIYSIDAPPPGSADVWQKFGYTKSQTYLALIKCGQGQIHSDEDLERRDLCMMRAGFKYVERPTHRMCQPQYARAWNSSVCRSLRGELIVTPDDSALLPPPVVDKTTPAHTYAPPIPVAPSTHLGQHMQEQVQKDSNAQINQLMHELKPRKQ